MTQNQKKKILIADDEIHIVATLELTLNQYGYDTHGIYNSHDSGKEIMECVHTNSYDLLLIDINRPSPNGLELIRKIREDGFDIPILVITGYGTPTNVLKAFEDGANDLIHKPFTLETLNQSIQRIFEKSNLTSLINCNHKSKIYGMRCGIMETVNKFKDKQYGILLIILGIFIPSILYPFTSLTSRAAAVKAVSILKGVYYDTTLRDLEIVIVEGEWKTTNNNKSSKFEGHVAIPYKYAVALGIILIFVGVSLIIFYRNKKVKT
jgi:CheY-like chemotaxis protein